MNDIFNAWDHDHPQGPGWIRTASSSWVNVLNPTVDMIYGYDIAYGLSKVNRFGGHTELPYSVAEHSLNVAALLERQFGDSKLTLAGLLHDAAEAYIGDMVRPLKNELPEFRAIERNLMQVIGLRFDLAAFQFTDHRIKAADEFMLVAEMSMIRDCTWRRASEPDDVAEAMHAQLQLPEWT